MIRNYMKLLRNNTKLYRIVQINTKLYILLEIASVNCRT